MSKSDNVDIVIPTVAPKPIISSQFDHIKASVKELLDHGFVDEGVNTGDGTKWYHHSCHQKNIDDGICKHNAPAGAWTVR